MSSNLTPSAINECSTRSAVAAIPANLLSLHLTHAKDIMGAAVILARHETKLAQETPEAAIVKDVSNVLTAAATCLAVLQVKPKR